MTEQLRMAGFDGLRADYESQHEQLRINLESLQQSLEEVAETAHSSDGLIAATIGARGELKELVLDPRIYRTTDATALATAITETIHAATEAVATRMMEIAEPLLPDGLPSGSGAGPDLNSVRQVTGRDGEN
jgi:DNA-binding protein YbaB